jgi:NAD-dependent deacetylase
MKMAVTPTPESVIPDSLVDALREADHVTVLTGAGMSAESGLATFRGKLTGLWENFNPMEIATPHAFEADPALVWGWYEWRRMSVMQAQPNEGHLAITALQRKLKHLSLVTQNVDDLHERAGAHFVQHLHGTMLQPRCMSCGRSYQLPPGIPTEPAGGRKIDPPRCTQCGSHIRPGVVWFGESLPRREWEAAERAARLCDVFFCVGTSGLVEPAASLVHFARERGALTIQINTEITGLEDRLSYSLRGSAAVVLPELVRRLGPRSRA